MSAFIFQDPTATALNQALSNVGGAFGEAIQKRRERKYEEKKQNILSNLLENIDTSTPIGKSKFLQEAIKIGVSPKDANSILSTIKPSILEEVLTKYSPSQQIENPNVSGGDVFGDPNTIEYDPTPSYEHPATSNTPFSNIPEEALVKLTASGDPGAENFSKNILELRDRAHRRYTEDRKYNTQRSQKYMEGIDQLRSNSRTKRAAIENMKLSIENRDLSFMTQDWWAQTLGKFGQGLVTPEGALLQSSIKEFLLGDLGRLTGRPNMFIEQRILQMAPKIGQTKESNFAMIASLEQQAELEEKRIQLTDEISETYEKQLGYVPGNISKLVDQAMEPFAQDAQNRLAYKLRSLQEQESGLNEISNKKVASGTPLTIEMAQFFVKKYGKEKAKKRAKSLGYTIPSREEYLRYVK